MTSCFFLKKKGQALIELLVAFGIASLILTSVTTLFIDIRTANLVSLQYTGAQNLLEEAVTALEVIKRRSFSELESAPSLSHHERVGGLFQLQEGTGTSSIYTIAIEKKEVRRNETGQIMETGSIVDPNAFAFQVTISWTTPRPRSLQRTVYFSRVTPNQVWTQTTQSDFEAGVLTNTTATVSPGDVVLVKSSDIFIERFYTETYKDQVATTAVWDTEAHQLRINTTEHYWIAQTSPVGADLNAVFFVDNDQGFAVGKSQVGRSTIIATSNGGEQWLDRSTTVTSAELTSVYFLNQTTGIAVGKGGTIIRTTDGGVTWNLIASPLQNDLNGIWFVDELTGVAVGAGGTVLRTTDGGLTWASISIGTTEQLNAIYFVNPTTGFVVGNNGLIYKTEDAGQTWVLKNSTTGRHLNAVFFADELMGYAVGNNGVILHSPDGGKTWTLQPTGTLRHLHAVWFVGDNGWAAGDGGTLLATENGGQRWTPEAIGTNKNLRGLHFESYDVGWVTGFNGEIRKFQPRYNFEGIGQSLKLNNSLAEISKATLISDFVLSEGTNIVFYLSADGGKNFERVTPGVPHVFARPGNDLRWKAALSTTVATKSPVVYKVQIDIGGGYNPTGTLESQTFDGSKTVGFNRIEWDVTLREGTDVTFQVAVSDNPDGPFNFVGPDGSPTSFYNQDSSRAFWYSVSAGRFLKFKAYLSTNDSAITPVLHEVRINYTP